jgi:hypothetical protein
MGSWSQVKWTQAGQIADLIGNPTGIDDREANPESGYRQLRGRGDLDLAVRYLAHALPRFEATAWVANLLDERSRSVSLSAVERQALDHVIRWVEEPSDEYRRATFEAGSNAPEDSPERLLASAVFMSGGSISEVDLPPVQPRQQVCGQLAAAAVLVAAYRSPDPVSALTAACDLGEKVAAQGSAALVRR